MRILLLTLATMTMLSQFSQAELTTETTPAGSQPATAPADPMSETRKIEEQIAKLADLPVVVELMKIDKQRTELRAATEKQIRELHSAAVKQIEPLDKEYQRLRESEEATAYRKLLSDLDAQRHNTWELERKAITEAARNIYAARHEELRRMAAHPVPNLGKLGLDVLSYPRVDGSTSTHPLSVIIACRAFGIPYEWVYPGPTGYPFHSQHPLTEDWDGAIRGGMYRDPMDMEFNLAASYAVARPAAPEQARLASIINNLLTVNASTHIAYENLINRKCDLNLTARPPSDDELKLAGEKGVKITIKPIARDAMVFIVNYKNSVTSLTREQIVDIYDGKITSWSELGWRPTEKELGGSSQTISPLRRERNSGSRELFDSLVMKGRQLPGEDTWGKSLFSSGMSGPFNRVTVEPLAIGYTVYYYEHFMAASAFTRTIAVDGVEPTPETIASGKYPFVAEVYAAYRDGEAADSPAMRMLNWLLSDEGQAVIRESGYVPAKQ